jgi:hypothetical protein
LITAVKKIAIVSIVALAISFLFQSSLALTNDGSIGAFESPITENFNSLAQTGTNAVWTDNSTLVGIYSNRSTFNAGTGSNNAGSLYSFGIAGTNPVTDRALGTVASGSAAPIFGVKLTNNTGSTITSLDVSYVGEQWRDGGNATPVAQTLDF